MARAETIVQLTEDLVTQLDLEAGRRGLSRSALIREACVAYLAEQSEAARVQRWIEGYKRIPQGNEVDEWGNLDEQLWAQHLENLRALEEEERRAGFDPW
jgi:predicted transcriptional regulator